LGINKRTPRGYMNRSSGKSRWGNLTGERVVVAEDLEVLPVARGAAVGGHDPVEGPVPAAEPRQPDPDHHGDAFFLPLPRRLRLSPTLGEVVWEQGF
jgi:hypothetical protein